MIKKKPIPDADQGALIRTHSVFWDALHQHQRFRPQYPNENVVRFLMVHFKQALQGRKILKALDIGVGGGRHLKLLGELGFQSYGVDISAEGLRHCAEWLKQWHLKPSLFEASMTKLPFESSFFDAVISFGVFYYGDSRIMTKAIGEVHRVLKPGGKAFIIIRTTDDFRFGKGKQVEPHTFKLSTQKTNEAGTVQHFVSEKEVKSLFNKFRNLSFEKSEVSFLNRKAVNSDWLITVER
jgi:SAM-dependent methyltransferase